MGLDAFPLDQPWLALPALFGAGLLTSLTPCVYPMIPITAAVLGGTGAARGVGAGRWVPVAATATYVLGLALVYALLGLLAGLTGTVFGAVSANPWAYFAMGNLLLVFGLMMFEVVPVPVPRGLLQWAATRGGRSYPAIFLMGASSGLVAAPCGAPAFGAVLVWVSSTQSALWGFLYLFVFSLGMTGLLVAVGLLSGAGAALPRAGRWMVWVKRGAGAVLFGMAQFYFVRMGQVL